MKELIIGLVGWASAHPHLAGLMVAVIACSESLAIIGLFIPGTLMMLVFGALVGAGALEFWSIYAWSVGGAILGDGASYLLGRHYRDHVTNIHAVRTRPQLLERGIRFFTRHGGKSIILARFVGPMRPVLPAVAGMLGMPAWKFYSYNIASALLWAPIHLIPGMAFGASLVLAGHVAWRLAIGLVLLIAFVWGVLWGAHTLYRWAQPHASAWLSRLSAWGKRSPPLTWLVGELLDPARPEFRPLLLWLALLIAGSWLFFGVLEDVVSLDPLVYASQSLYQVLQQLRTPFSDLIMTSLTELGDINVALPVTLAVLLWFLWHRAWRDAWYWIAAISFGVVAVLTFKYALHLPRPVLLYSGANAFSFPSGHATLNTLIYGYLAVLCSYALPPRWRWIAYASAALLIIGIAFSRLYLGAHWLADVVAGLGLGTAWVALLAIARARHSDRTPLTPGFPLLVVVIFLGAASVHIRDSLTMDIKRYSVQITHRQMDFFEWWVTDWQQLSAYRIDLEGEKEQPLNVQWAGPLSELEHALQNAGWHKPQALTPVTALNWLVPKPVISDLPVLPQLNRGRYEALVLVHADQRNIRNYQLVLRMWPASVTLMNPQVPVWYGTVTLQRIEHLPLINFPINSKDYDAAIEYMQQDLQGLHYTIVQRPPLPCKEPPFWGDKVLLVTSGKE